MASSSDQINDEAGADSDSDIAYYLTPAGYAEAERLKVKLAEAGITREELDAEIDKMRLQSYATVATDKSKQPQGTRIGRSARPQRSTRGRNASPPEQGREVEEQPTGSGIIMTQKMRDVTDPSRGIPSQNSRKWGDVTVARRYGQIDWTLPGLRLCTYLIFQHLPDDHDLRIGVFNKMFKEELALCGKPNGTNYQKLRAQLSTMKSDNANKLSHWTGVLADAKGAKGDEMLRKIKELVAEIEAAREGEKE